jgi:VWFA-related protein
MPRSPRPFGVAGTIVSSAIALAAAVLWASGPADPLEPPPAARQQAAQGRDRALFVSVVDEKGEPVTTLSARDFVVREDGRAREVLTAEPSEAALTLALLVDNSQAASAATADLRKALTTFVKTIGEKNTIAVTTFADRPTIVQDYTLVLPQVIQAVERIFPVSGSGSYLLQAIRDISTGFSKRDFERGVIVAVTTEGPEFSDLNHDLVEQALRGSGATLHAVVIRSTPPPNPTEQSTRERALVLDAGPRATGGRRVDVLSSMGLDDALAKLARQLQNEFRITYARPDALVPPEKVEVSVKRPGLDARGIPARSPRG